MCFVTQVRRQVLGPTAAPLLVIGPRPLQRALRAYTQLEPLTFRYLDTSHTAVGLQFTVDVAFFNVPMLRTVLWMLTLQHHRCPFTSSRCGRCEGTTVPVRGQLLVRGASSRQLAGRLLAHSQPARFGP